MTVEEIECKDAMEKLKNEIRELEDEDELNFAEKQVIYDELKDIKSELKLTRSELTNKTLPESTKMLLKLKKVDYEDEITKCKKSVKYISSTDLYTF